MMRSEETDINKEESKCKVSVEKSGRKEAARRGRKPGRKPTKVDMKAKLERSRQSARECRARKKLRYQYLEELVAHREQAVLMLRKELELYRQWCKEIDEGKIPEGALKLITAEDVKMEEDEKSAA
uniref:BZIP domain-containing protein n=1 Tax=Strigamia maritima TaxID=126957 RepID=T1JA53_STRMM